jgi:GT2 family glycosyltransferase
MKLVSIIIVSYNSKIELKHCLKSIPKNNSYETIVIDNTKINRGFSKACNLGAQQATGKYLFFLNPDTQLQSNTIRKLVKKISSDKKIGIIAPQLLDKQKKPYRSYSLQPRFLTAPILFSFIRSLLPKDIICTLHSYECDTLKETKYVEAVSGAAMMIEKKLFHTIGGFDEDLFLYWEDYEICKKVTVIGKKILYYSQAKLTHTQGGATKNKVKALQLFQQSRFIFFKKRFGIIYSLCLEAFLRLTEKI